MKSIINGVILKDNKLIENSILLFNDKIIDIVDVNEYKKHKDCVTMEYDANGSYVLPGFIDQHVHGYIGYDVMDNDEKAIREIKKAVVQNGVTSFLPTTLTASKEELQKVCDSVNHLKYNDKNGAKIIGVHLEGPYINVLKKGAQNEKFIVSPDFDFIDNNQNILKIVTIAPEVEGSLELIKKFGDKINFQIGHTNANYEKAIEGIDNGAKGFTHTFNAMTGIHHRDLGVVGACMQDDRAYAEIICDNIHLDKNVYDFVIKNKGIDKVLLITDCMRAGGLNDGEYDLGGLTTTLKGDECRLLDGTLAGSVLKANYALKNIVENSKTSFVDCVKMITENQAKYLGLENEIGKIEIGVCSDLVIINKDYEVQKTFVDGECVHEVLL